MQTVTGKQRKCSCCNGKGDKDGKRCVKCLGKGVVGTITK